MPLILSGKTLSSKSSPAARKFNPISPSCSTLKVKEIFLPDNRTTLGLAISTSLAVFLGLGRGPTGLGFGGLGGDGGFGGTGGTVGFSLVGEVGFVLGSTTLPGVNGLISSLPSSSDLVDSKKHEEKYYYRKDHQYYPALAKEVKSFDTVYQWRGVYLRENKQNICPTLTANMGTGGHNVPIILDNFGIRMLTPIECSRFQSFPEKFQFPDNVAQGQRYKQVSNSVVIPVIKKIAKNIYHSLEAD